MDRRAAHPLSKAVALDHRPGDDPEAQVDAIIEALKGPGFCVVRGVLPPDLARAMRAVLQLILDEEPATPGRNGHSRLLYPAVRHPVFNLALTHPLALAVWRRFLSPDMICSTFSASILQPGSTEQYWHADHPYWTLAPPWPAVPLTGQNIWFLDDFHADNGATAGIPFSHTRNALPPLEERDSDEAQLLTGPAGSVVFAHGAWWHTTRPNRSGVPRCALLATYTHTFCTPQEDMRAQLAQIDEPSDVLRHLLGGKQYQPQRGFPY